MPKYSAAGTTVSLITSPLSSSTHATLIKKRSGEARDQARNAQDILKTGRKLQEKHVKCLGEDSRVHFLGSESDVMPFLMVHASLDLSSTNASDLQSRDQGTIRSNVPQTSARDASISSISTLTSLPSSEFKELAEEVEHAADKEHTRIAEERTPTALPQSKKPRSRKSRSATPGPSAAMAKLPMLNPSTARKRALNIANSPAIPRALSIQVRLEHEVFSKLTGKVNTKSVRTEIFINGVFSSSCLSNSQCYNIALNSGEEQSAHVYLFSGTRCDKIGEKPWIIVPPGQKADGSLRGGHNRSITAEERWKEVNQALLEEARARGISESGILSPTGKYLEQIAKMDPPAQIHSFQKPGGPKFGVIDVVVCLGYPGKRSLTDKYIVEPTRFLDERFKPAEEWNNADDDVPSPEIARGDLAPALPQYDGADDSPFPRSAQQSPGPRNVQNSQQASFSGALGMANPAYFELSPTNPQFMRSSAFQMPSNFQSTSGFPMYQRSAPTTSSYAPNSIGRLNQGAGLVASTTPQQNSDLGLNLGPSTLGDFPYAIPSSQSLTNQGLTGYDMALSTNQNEALRSPFAPSTRDFQTLTGPLNQQAHAFNSQSSNDHFSPYGGTPHSGQFPVSSGPFVSPHQSHLSHGSPSLQTPTLSTSGDVRTPAFLTVNGNSTANIHGTSPQFQGPQLPSTGLQAASQLLPRTPARSVQGDQLMRQNSLPGQMNMMMNQSPMHQFGSSNMLSSQTFAGFGPISPNYPNQNHLGMSPSSMNISPQLQRQMQLQNMQAAYNMGLGGSAMSNPSLLPSLTASGQFRLQQPPHLKRTKSNKLQEELFFNNGSPQPCYTGQQTMATNAATPRKPTQHQIPGQVESMRQPPTVARSRQSQAAEAWTPPPKTPRKYKMQDAESARRDSAFSPVSPTIDSVARKNTRRADFTNETIVPMSNTPSTAIRTASAKPKAKSKRTPAPTPIVPKTIRKKKVITPAYVSSDEESDFKPSEISESKPAKRSKAKLARTERSVSNATAATEASRRHRVGYQDTVQSYESYIEEGFTMPELSEDCVVTYAQPGPWSEVTVGRESAAKRSRMADGTAAASTADLGFKQHVLRQIQSEKAADFTECEILVGMRFLVT